MKKNGFTLLEMLIVIAILSILVTLGSKALRSARTSAKKTQASVEMASIETAVKSYFNEYGKLPVVSEKQGTSDPDGSETFSREVLEILTANNSTDNPREIVFIEPQSNAIDPVFFDPWGEPYLIYLDTDYNGEISPLGSRVKRKSGVVSTGLFLLNKSSNTNEIITSWQ